jgi:CheY-like chemotaxis protein
MILVVDDEISLRDVIIEILDDEGYTVRTAGNGGTALAMMAAERIDLVLMDIMMPIMSGLEAMTVIRTWAAGSAPPIVLMSAVVRRARDRIGVEFLRKPFDLDVLLHLVERSLAG